MGENKKIFKISVILSLVVLLLAVVLEWHGCTIKHKTFIINILLALFGSGTLVAIVSYNNYTIAKKSSLNEFYIKVLIYESELNIFSYEVAKNKEANLSEYLDTLHREHLELENKFIELKLISSRITVFRNRKGKKLNETISGIILICEKIHMQLIELKKLSQNIIPEPGNKDDWLKKILPKYNLQKDLKKQVEILERLIGVQVDLDNLKEDDNEQ